MQLGDFMAKTSRQYLKTEEKLMEFLPKFLLEHQEKKVSIFSLCSALGITRHTFYNHYPNLRELYDSYTRKRYQRFKEEFEEKTKGSSNRKRIVSAYVDLVEEYRIDWFIVPKMQSHAPEYSPETIFTEFILNRCLGKCDSLTKIFLIQGSVSIIREFVMNEGVYSKEKIKKKLLALLNKLIVEKPSKSE